MTKNLSWMVDPVANVQFADTNLGMYELRLVKVEYHSLTFNGEELSRVVAPAHEFNREIVAEAHYSAMLEGRPFRYAHTTRTELEWQSRERELLQYNNDLLEKQREDAKTCKKAVNDFNRVYALLKRVSSAVCHAADNAEDEGDRVYFGSTNDLDDLKDVNEELVAFEFDVEVEKGNT